jgi:hypothetical protein
MKNLGLTSSCHGRRSGLTPERRWNKQRRFTDEFKREAVRLIHISGRVFGGLGILARRAVRLFKEPFNRVALSTPNDAGQAVSIVSIC